MKACALLLGGLNKAHVRETPAFDTAGMRAEEKSYKASSVTTAVEMQKIGSAHDISLGIISACFACTWGPLSLPACSLGSCLP